MDSRRALFLSRSKDLLRCLNWQILADRLQVSEIISPYDRLNLEKIADVEIRLKALIEGYTLANADGWKELIAVLRSTKNNAMADVLSRVSAETKPNEQRRM
jgi:hypothetical protein